jgi:type IV pilus assembly protein PilW
MTRHHLAPGLRYSKGFSLIELMVSLTIGLIISIAAFSAYLGAAGASRMTEAQGRMNEDAQAALTILTQQLRMAGNNPQQADRVVATAPTLSSLHNPVYGSTPFLTDPTTFELSTFIIRGCSGTFSNISTAANLDALICVPDTTKPDSIAVNYEADRFNTIPTTGNLPTDCLGNTLATITAEVPVVISTAPVVTSTVPVTYSVADNRFYIGTSTASSSSIPSLYCKGNGGSSTAQPLVENIEDMRFTYGTVAASTTDTAVTTASVAGYLSADEIVSNASLAALADDAARWKKVVTVRICVLVRSENPVVTDLASARYFKCDGTLETAPPDLRLRRAYSTTVVLRNRRL